MKKRILTGDRPTGKLHLGHYVGSLKNRVELQKEYDCFFIIADYQVLNEHLKDTKKIEQHIQEIILDYLSVGIDPEKSIIFIQSKIPQIAELTVLFSMMVTLARVKRNPTVKEEFENSNISEISYGFVGYPISQAADILCVRSNLIPVGEDQLPHIEQTREIARKFNRLFGNVFPIPEALLGEFPRLPGLDGRKMSKSLGNAVYFSDSEDEVNKKIKSAITDPKRIHPNDPGHPEVCNIFQYHKAFANQDECNEIQKCCSQGSIGCVDCKKRLINIVNNFIDPIRQSRKLYENKKEFIKEVLNQGNTKVIKEAEFTLNMVKEAMFLNYPNLLI